MAAGTLSKDGLARVRYLPWEKFDTNDSSTTTLDYAKDAVVLSPLVGWEFQYRSLIEQFVYGRSTLTMDTIDQLRIYSPGGADSVSLEPKEQVRFRDPQTGVEYVARTYGKEAVNTKNVMSEKSSGARMIQYANSVVAANFVVDATDPVNGELTVRKDASGGLVCQAGKDCFGAATRLKGYVSNLDVVRQLSLWFGYGPLNR